MLRAVPHEVPMWTYAKVPTKVGIKIISYSRHIFYELQNGDILIFSKIFIVTTSETTTKL